MGGRLWFESLENGTVFHFTTVFGNLKTRGKKTLPDKADLEKKPNLVKYACKVLLAEDDSMNRELISSMVTSVGCRLATAENGKQALEIVEEEPFDLILMDISMPVMDGLTATDRIRKLPEDHINFRVPIVALTAHAMAEDVDRFIGHGINQVLTKPLSLESLREVIDVHCQIDFPVS